MKKVADRIHSPAGYHLVTLAMCLCFFLNYNIRSSILCTFTVISEFKIFVYNNERFVYSSPLYIFCSIYTKKKVSARSSYFSFCLFQINWIIVPCYIPIFVPYISTETALKKVNLKLVFEQTAPIEACWRKGAKFHTWAAYKPLKIIV